MLDDDVEADCSWFHVAVSTCPCLLDEDVADFSLRFDDDVSDGFSLFDDEVLAFWEVRLDTLTLSLFLFLYVVFMFLTFLLYLLIILGLSLVMFLLCLVEALIKVHVDDENKFIVIST